MVVLHCSVCIIKFTKSSSTTETLMDSLPHLFCSCPSCSCHSDQVIPNKYKQYTATKLHAQVLLFHRVTEFLTQHPLPQQLKASFMKRCYLLVGFWPCHKFPYTLQVLGKKEFPLLFLTMKNILPLRFRRNFCYSLNCICSCAL